MDRDKVKEKKKARQRKGGSLRERTGRERDKEGKNNGENGRARNYAGRNEEVGYVKCGERQGCDVGR